MAIVGIAVLLGTGLYLLYDHGALVSRHIRAVLFVFRHGMAMDSATLDSCTGRVRHTGRFRENKVYEFRFDAQLSKGDAEVFLLDRDRRELLQLSQRFPTGRIKLEGKNKYYLRWDFKNATGRCELRWQTQAAATGKSRMAAGVPAGER